MTQLGSTFHHFFALLNQYGLLFVVQDHPTAAFAAADTPAAATNVSHHGRDVAGICEAMQHTVAETPRKVDENTSCASLLKSSSGTFALLSAQRCRLRESCKRHLWQLSSMCPLVSPSARCPLQLPLLAAHHQ